MVYPVRKATNYSVMVVVIVIVYYLFSMGVPCYFLSLFESLAKAPLAFIDTNFQELFSCRCQGCFRDCISGQRILPFQSVQ